MCSLMLTGSLTLFLCFCLLPLSPALSSYLFPECLSLFQPLYHFPLSVSLCNPFPCNIYSLKLLLYLFHLFHSPSPLNLVPSFCLHLSFPLTHSSTLHPFPLYCFLSVNPSRPSPSPLPPSPPHSIYLSDYPSLPVTIAAVPSIHPRFPVAWPPLSPSRFPVPSLRRTAGRRCTAPPPPSPTGRGNESPHQLCTV